MNIQWHEVTWYSKALALGFFFISLFVGICLALFYGELEGSMMQANADQKLLNENHALANIFIAKYVTHYNDPLVWPQVKRDDGGFTISYPLDFDETDNYSSAVSPDWRIDANGAPGIKMLTITVPRAFEPQTNFADATVTVGRSKDKSAVAHCLDAGASGNEFVPATSTKIINGIQFLVSNSTGAGAGNYYETTSYRALHAGQCYAVEYTVHSTQIMNYPESYGLKPFDDAMVHGVLDRIVGTFTFE